ncbi:MAG: AMP-binding protein [Microbacteriaceae bacterium]|nr:AMP-binding protein [Microbacteriaceae bacterium]
MRNLIQIPANKTFEVLVALTQALEGGDALFVSGAEVNGIAPVEDVPGQVSDNTAVVIKSSGSTGRPKLIELSAEAMLASAKATEQTIGSGQWLLTLPVNYVAGLMVLVRSIKADQQPVLMNTQVPFTPEAFVRGASLMEEGQRFVSLVPTQLARLAEAIDLDPMVYSSLRKFEAILVGGQRADFAVMQKLKAMGINLISTYGMTETSGGCVYDGEPIGDTQLRINDDQLEVSGSVLANGLPEWFSTNDLARINDSGKLEILGRADRVIISGGLKVSLDRVEEISKEIAGVSEIVAVGIEDKEFGERVAIGFEGTPEVSDAISEHLIEIIGREAKPKKILQFRDLPRLESQKPDLQRIQKLMAE